MRRWRLVRRSVAPTLALILVGACAPRASTRTALVAERTEPLSGSDIQTYARLLQMADARRLDTAIVQRALHSPSRPLRAAATRAIGQVHGYTMAPLLRTLLADEDTAVAANAAFALGLLSRDSASMPALASALRARGPVAVEAAWALGKIGAPARGSIEGALASDAMRPDVTGMLLLAAATLRPVPIRVVTRYLNSPDAELRWRAAYAIARPYAATGVRAVLALRHDPSALVRAQVARALAFRAAGDSLRTQALAALDTLVRDADAHVRIEALRSLGGYGSDARDPVFAAIHDPDANVRVTAAQTLAHVLGRSRQSWMAAWNADTGFMYRKSVLESALSNDVVLPAADEDNPDGWRHLGDWRYRAAVAQAAMHATSVDRIREIALPLARDPDPRVRVAAFTVFAPHVDSAAMLHHQWRRDLMIWALGDWDYDVRTIAIGSLDGHASASEVPAVLRSYHLALQHDTVNDAEVAAIRYIVHAWRHDSLSFSDSLRAAIAALPAPTDPAVRAAAGQTSLFSSWPAATRAERPLAWYVERVRSLVVPALAGHEPHVAIVTDRGTMQLELYAADAPLTVDNFLSLVRAEYYDNVHFHRVVPDFVVQDGDRRGDGTGGPAYSIRDELNRRRYDRGAVGMALAGPDTGGSQYFITLSAQPHLDGGYTVFGHVTSGYDVLDAIVQGDRIAAIRLQ